MGVDEIPDCDLICGGSPCFAKGTLILTYNGYKPIEECKIGDLVLTHKGRWKPITNTMRRLAKSTITIKGHGLHNLRTTEEHPFYARKQAKKWNKERRSYDRIYTTPCWEDAGKLTRKHRISTVLPIENEQDEYSEDFWWVVGRYLADGWRVERKNRKNNGRVVICCGKSKFEDTKRNIFKAFHATIVEERTAYKFHITNTPFYRFLEQFGKGAKGKHIPGKYICLKPKKLKALFEGYISGDGCFIKKANVYSATTISEKLAYGLLLVFQKISGRIGTISYNKRPNKCIIEGRVCNQNNFYTIKFPNINRSGFVEKNYGWKLLSNIEKEKGCWVYNISVEDDETYTANNTVVHNCQNFSIAGERMGFEGTRGTLFFEFARFVKAKQPQYFLFENVPGLLSHNMGRTAITVLSTFDELGYDVEWQCLNAKNFGVPQNRERIFIIGHSRKRSSRQVFPLQANDIKFSKKEGRKQTIAESGIASTLKAQYYKISADSTYVKTDRIGGLYDKDGERHQAGSIYNPEGLAPTLETCQGGHRQPMIPLRWRRTEKGKEERRKAMVAYSKDYTPFSPDCREFVASEDNSVGCITSGTNKDALIGVDNMTDYAIRRLTPIECERLMGFKDFWTEKGIDHKGKEFEISDTQRYKMCGNSIVTNVADAIIEKLNETLEVEK